MTEGKESWSRSKSKFEDLSPIKEDEKESTELLTNKDYLKYDSKDWQ